MTRYVYILMIFCFFALGLTAQNQDSLDLQNAIQQSRIFLEQSQTDSAILFAERALKGSQQNEQRVLEIDALYLLAQAHFQKEEIRTSLRYYLQTLKAKEGNDTDFNLATLHFEIADLYKYWKVYEKSIQQYQLILDKYGDEHIELKKQALEHMATIQLLNQQPEKALQYARELRSIYESEKNEAGAIATLIDIIKINKEIGNFEAALADNEKVLTYNEFQKDTAAVIVALNNIGVLHRQLGHLEDALNNFSRSAALQTLYQNQPSATTLINIGILHQNLRNYLESLNYLADAETNIRNTPPIDFLALTEIYNLLSIVHLSRNDINAAFQYNQLAIDLSLSIGDKNLEQISYQSRAKICEQFNDFEQALSYFQMHTHIKDSLILNQHAQQQSNLTKQFSAEQTEKEISLLAIDREIEDLKYQQELLENEKLRQSQALQQSLLVQERLEKEQTEQALELTEQKLEQEKAQQELFLAQQELEAEQKDRQIALLENEQTNQALEIARQDLVTKEKDNEIAKSEKAQVELELSLREKDFQLTNQRETSLRNLAVGFLIVSLLILGLLYRTFRIRNKANRIIGKRKKELETALSDLQQTQTQLVQSEKMASLGQLTAGVAHEINNPINFITTSVDALKYDVADLDNVLGAVLNLKKDDPKSIQVLLELREKMDVNFLKNEVGELISNIEIGASRTHDIVTALRTYSRDTSEKFNPADIHEGIDSSLVILNHKKGEQIEIVKNYDQLPPIQCMASRLNQVFLNILDNAIQAIEEAGKITISTKLNNDDTVTITFEDTGKGMSVNSIKNAFNPFYTTKDVGAGTGLGLYVSYNIIQQHHGNISITSAEGKGSLFTLVIPVRQDGSPDPA